LQYLGLDLAGICGLLIVLIIVAFKKRKEGKRRTQEKIKTT
jgi:hypothetical protein